MVIGNKMFKLPEPDTSEYWIVEITYSSGVSSRHVVCLTNHDWYQDDKDYPDSTGLTMTFAGSEIGTNFTNKQIQDGIFYTDIVFNVGNSKSTVRRTTYNFIKRVELYD